MAAEIPGMTGEEYREWVKLGRAIDEAETQVPCISWPEIFHLEGTDQSRNVADTRIAKSFCDACPVKVDCLAYGLKWDEYGIYGGMTPNERRKFKRSMGASPSSAGQAGLQA